MATRKLLMGTLGGLLGMIAGVMGGGFLGLVVGGTFLGWLEFARWPGLTGYELAAYAGGFLGGLAVAPLGVGYALQVAVRAGRNE